MDLISINIARRGLTVSMISIDNQKIFKIIEERKPRSVALDGPDGLMSKIQDTADVITEKYGIPAYIIGDTCWGSCDLNTHAADVLGAEILFNIGHTISMDGFGQEIIMIDAYEDIPFDKVARSCASELIRMNYKNLSLLTISQHLGQLNSVREIFEQSGIRVTIGVGKGQLNDGQVFGCEFYPAHCDLDKIDCFVFLGQSTFHSAGVALSTGKHTYMLDPYYQEYTEVSSVAKELHKKAILSVYKAIDANTIGIIIGIKDGQFAKTRALELRNELKRLGRKVRLIGLTEITEDRIQIFTHIDAFVQVACPRIGIDNHFTKPMLSVPQARALIRLLKKEPTEDIFRLSHWL
jgi:2-(3-amino-3-carboxypropyl)histidine synthase